MRINEKQIKLYLIKRIKRFRKQSVMKGYISIDFVINWHDEKNEPTCNSKVYSSNPVSVFGEGNTISGAILNLKKEQLKKLKS